VAAISENEFASGSPEARDTTADRSAAHGRCRDREHRRTSNWVTYKTADNRRVIRAVADPKLLDGLEPGDVIEVTLTRERVIELERR
jgi:hypothetical protein